jgi:hypothetical protein
MLAMLEQLKLLQHMTPSFYSQPSRLCIKKCMGYQVHPQVLCKKFARHTNVVFGVGLFEEETCFEQLFF